MSELTTPVPVPETIKAEERKKRASSSTLARVARYTAVRLITLSITVVIGVYLTILIANMGGYVDQIRLSQVREDINVRVAGNPANRNLTPEARSALIATLIDNETKRLGMDQPFITRSFNYLADAITLNLGRATNMTSNSGSSSVRLIILERLPPTLVLFGFADLILFFAAAMIFALALSRSYGSFFDKLAVTLTPLSSAPGWFYGIFLILIFASINHFFPFGGMVDAPPPADKLDYALSMLKHMVLPIAAYSLSGIFLSIFSWRTFFLIYSSEDYVDMAKAKGLPSKDINNKYILRPTLPTIITSFALIVIVSWQGAPIFETIFQWPGLGRALFSAIGLFDTPVIVASTVIFAYLLAITVFLLDIVYAIVDPRRKNWWIRESRLIMNFRSLKELFKYPTALVGVIMIMILIVISIVTVIVIPYDKAIQLWRGAEVDWYKSPKLAGPVWLNWFRTDKLPETLDLTADSAGVEKKVTKAGSSTLINYTFKIPFNYDSYADDFAIYFKSTFKSKAPFVGITWLTPDGTKIRLSNFALKNQMSYRVSQDNALSNTKLGGAIANIGLFAGKTFDSPKPVKGTYTLTIEGTTFEPDSDYSAEVILYGKLAGWAGTDNLRRDIGIALLWGTPIALAFGLLAAVGTSFAQLIIAGISTWFGGWVDTIIQRITEVNLVLPFLPILIMVGTFYNRSLPVMLGVVILLSIFGSGIKTFRAQFMQVKESPYIEAARSYGAGSFRIIFTYMIPRLIPLLIPQFITLIPSYVFLEASLAVLGLGDPTLPTWGKLIDDSYAAGALFQGWYYWVLEPSALLMITGLAFSAVGYAMDRIFNPRLREQ